MISLNLNAAKDIAEKGESVAISRGLKKLGSMKALIEPAPQGFFAAVPLNPYQSIQRDDVLASEKRQFRAVHCVASNACAAIWHCEAVSAVNPQSAISPAEALAKAGPNPTEGGK